MFVVAVATASVAAGAANGGPSLGSKRAQAQQVMGRIQELDSGLERGRNAYESATAKLNGTEHNLQVNRIGLRAARANLGKAQVALAQRLVAIYTTRDEQSTLAVLLGAQSIDDLIGRIETVESVSSQDVAVMKQVLSFKGQIVLRRKRLVQALIERKRLVAQRAAATASIGARLAKQQRLLSSIRGEIANLIRMENARQLAAARAARAAVPSVQAQQAAALTGSPVGVAAPVLDGPVAPPSKYGGVVAIALRYLGVPYLWGGASPSTGFDCSGFTMFVYAQVGVSLPHYTGAQWTMGVPVARNDLQPGDLLFFDGLGHEGMYIGNNQMIHAPRTGDVVKISSLTGWYDQTYMGARRITG